MAGVEPVGGIDIWKDAVDTYKLNFPDAKAYCSDIRKLSARQVAKEVGGIDILLASPECTSHSVARGNRKPCDSSRKTAFEVIRFARAMKPRWVVVENVVAMQRWDQYGNWLRRLQGLGYNVLEAKLDASDYGVAQSRRRLFVMCDRERQPTVPSKRTGRKCTVGQILEPRAIVNGYNFTFSPLEGNGRAEATLARARRAIKELGRDQPFLIVYYGSDAVGGWQSLDRPLRTITTLDRFALVRPTSSGHEMRMLQPSELAAAMGFPDDYKWVKTCRRVRIKLVGNAVSPLMMKAVIENLVAE
jgi:DNA (cytosine-5)-methyltransferase 1